MATIKQALLRHSATLTIPSGVTDWQGNITGSTVALAHVHIQRQSGMDVNALNQEVQTQAKMWIDAKLSTPKQDWMTLKASAEAVGATLTVAYGGHSYTVSRVIECLDGLGRLHHYEVEMV